MAAEQGADWVINSDADEFWWPCNGTLKTTLAALPDNVEACRVERTNFLPPPRDEHDQRPFHQRQLLRERVSLNSLGEPLPPKLIHRAHPQIEVSDGNHGASRAGQPLQGIDNPGIEILHIPIRSYPQLERKIRQGAEALKRNRHVAPEVGNSWRRLYNTHLQQGLLPDYYDSLRPDEASLVAQLSRGEVLEDRRLQQVLGG